jgi:hypothetical protein
MAHNGVFIGLHLDLIDAYATTSIYQQYPDDSKWDRPYLDVEGSKNLAFMRFDMEPVKDLSGYGNALTAKLRIYVRSRPFEI